MSKKFSLGVKHQVFNNEVRKRRLEMGLSQKELGKLCGIGIGSMSGIETFRKYPRYEEAQKIAKVLDTTIGTLFPKWLEEIKPKRSTVVTEHLIDERTLEYEDLMALPSPDDMEKEVECELLAEDVEKVLCTLSERERKVIEMRFGLNGKEAMTLEEVGKVFGVMRERIRQIEAKALRKLKHPSRSKGLKGYLY